MLSTNLDIYSMFLRENKTIILWAFDTYETMFFYSREGIVWIDRLLLLSRGMWCWSSVMWAFGCRFFFFPKSLKKNQIWLRQNYIRVIFTPFAENSIFMAKSFGKTNRRNQQHWVSAHRTELFTASDWLAGPDDFRQSCCMYCRTAIECGLGSSTSRSRDAYCPQKKHQHAMLPAAFSRSQDLMVELPLICFHGRAQRNNRYIMILPVLFTMKNQRRLDYWQGNLRFSTVTRAMGFCFFPCYDIVLHVWALEIPSPCDRVHGPPQGVLLTV